MAALVMAVAIVVPGIVVLGAQAASAIGCTSSIGLGINSTPGSPVRVGDSVIFNVEVDIPPDACPITSGTLTLTIGGEAPETLSTSVVVGAGSGNVYMSSPYIVSQADIDPATDDVTATANINATVNENGFPEAATGFTTYKILVIRPETTLSVSANPSTGSAPLSVTYTYLETNSSPDTDPTALSYDGITGVTVTDPNCAPVVFQGSSDGNDTTLDPGATWTYTCSETYSTTGTYTETATGNGTAGDGRPEGTPDSFGAPGTEKSSAALVNVTPVNVHAGAIELWVKPPTDGGSDTGNDCLLASKPCATIEHAINVIADLGPDTIGSVINLSAGTFDSPSDTLFAGLGTGGNAGKNDNLTITGAGPTTIVEPTMCSQLGTVTDPSSPDSGDSAIVVFDDPGGVTSDTIDGVTVENMTLNGAGIAGGACGNYIAGVIDTSGTTGDAVVGDSIRSGATYGILTDDGSDSTIISNSLTPALCTTTVTGPNTGLNGGWTSPANLKIKAVPNCAKFIESGHGYATGVFINGQAYCVTTSASKKILVLTGTPAAGGCPKSTPISNSGGIQVATGSTVVFNTSVWPFSQYGIACNSPSEAENQLTDCAMSDNTVTAGGTVYGDAGMTCGGTPPIGIVATGGATADVDGNTVTDVADDIIGCPEEGESTQDGVGIAFIPDTVDKCSAGNSEIGVNDVNSPNTGHGNTLTGNDEGILVAGNTSGSCTTPTPQYQVNANKVTSAVEDGIVLTDLGFGNGNVLPLEVNSVAGVTGGPALELEGVNGQTIGGALASAGNQLANSEFGLVLTPCLPLSYHPMTPPGCVTYAGSPVLGNPETTDGNLIQNNTMTGNVDYGVLIVGGFQPEEVAGPTTFESSGNTFDANIWGTATSVSNGIDSTDIDGAEVMDGTGWGGGCSSKAGECPAAGPLVFEGPNTTFSSTFPGTATFSLSVCNNGPNSEVLPVGTEITFYKDNPGDSGTFFVTKDSIITGNAGCKGPFYNLSLQAIAPIDVGTDLSPTGQPYLLAQGATIEVNVNGAATASTNFYGEGSSSNTCTPAGINQTAGNGPAPLSVPHPAAATPDVFGATDPPSSPYAYSTTLQASTGGVNATYSAC